MCRVIYFAGEVVPEVTFVRGTADDSYYPSGIGAESILEAQISFDHWKEKQKKKISSLKAKNDYFHPSLEIEIRDSKLAILFRDLISEESLP